MGRPGERQADLVYVQLKRYDPDAKKVRHVRGSTIKIQGWTPEEVGQIIVRAFGEAARSEEPPSQTRGDQTDENREAAGLRERPEGESGEEEEGG